MRKVDEETHYKDNTWIETFTGKRFYILSPAEDMINIEDIAHSLSLLCRYNGHCKQFYSVAEHSIRVSELVPVGDRLAALLHDAAEAYLSDIPRPLKMYLKDIKSIEDRIQAMIHSAFGIKGNEAEIKKADNILLATEARSLMVNTDDWYLSEEPLSIDIIPMESEIAESLFLFRFLKYSEAKDVN
jgi:hypothetical protein